MIIAIISLCVILLFILVHLIKITKIHKFETNQLQNKIDELTKKETLIISVNENNKQRNEELKKEEDELLSKLSKIKDEIRQEIDFEKQNIENQRELLVKSASDSFSSQCDSLETSYVKTEEQYKQKIKLLEQEKANIEQELEKIKSTRQAAIQANIREKEVEEKLSFFCPKISTTDLADIKVLNSIKSELRNPRILNMLIWSTYYQKPMTTICNNVVGLDKICGIYKITNQLTKMCYIGQSVDIAKRFKEHAKCGLGIDTPAGNKLYKAMQENGLENFSFEVLEKCSSEQLNEKEKYYISLYDAFNYGYNSNSGNKK